VATVNKVFWAIAAVEAAFFVVAFVMTLNQGGHSDGGQEMALAFQIALPFLVLAVASLIFWKTSSPTLHIILLIAMTVPVALLARQWIHSFIDARASASGSYLFTDPALQKFLAAIHDLDTKKVRDLATRVDINSAGENSSTPLTFAVQNAATAEAKAQPAAGQQEMISLLLSLGAKPAPALEYACGMTHSDVLRLLLEAGADPNTIVGQQDMKEPVFYACFRSEHPTENLRLLSQKGANLDAPSYDGKTAIWAASIYSRWDAALFLLDHGANLDAITPDGKTVRSHVQEETARQIGYHEKGTVPEPLQQFAARLKE
jgi:hypothetical protein